MQGLNAAVRRTSTVLAGLAILFGLAFALREFTNAASALWLGARPPYITPPTRATIATIIVTIASGPALLAVAESTTRQRPGTLTRTQAATGRLLRWGRDALGLSRIDARGLLLAAGATTLTLGVSITVALTIATPSPDDPRFLATAGMSPLERGLAFAGAGPSEELLFRGPLLLAAALTHTAGTRWRAVLISTATFAALHPGAAGLVSAGVNGAVWCALVLITRSLWPAVISHCVHNFATGLLAG